MHAVACSRACLRVCVTHACVLGRARAGFHGACLGNISAAAAAEMANLKLANLFQKQEHNSYMLVSSWLRYHGSNLLFQWVSMNLQLLGMRV
jgi:hypothetical protein